MRKTLETNQVLNETKKHSKWIPNEDRYVKKLTTEELKANYQQRQTSDVFIEYTTYFFQ